MERRDSRFHEGVRVSRFCLYILPTFHWLNAVREKRSCSYLTLLVVFATCYCCYVPVIISLDWATNDQFEESLKELLCKRTIILGLSVFFTYTVFFRNWWTNVSVYIHHWFPPTQMLLGHAFWKKSDCCIMKDNTMSAFHYVEGSSWDSFSIERYIALIMWTKSVKKKMCCLFQKLHILLPIWGKDLLSINMRIWDFDCDVISVRKGWGDCCE